MNTIIEVQYQNYAENVIVTEDNQYEVLDLLATKDVLDYTTLVEGDVDVSEINNETLLGVSGGRNVGVVRSLETRLHKMEQRRFFQTDKEAYAHFEKIKTLSANIDNRTNNLTNKERLFI